MNLCVIPARGGSKRIPRKNIRLFAGKPIIAYAIETARQSGLFSRIIISTEDPEVKKVSQSCGAEVPFLRPAELADDYTPTVPVIAHAIRALERDGQAFDHVCCIYPCVPFLEVKDLVVALDLLKKSKAEYAIAIAEFSSAVQRALKVDGGSRIRPWFSENELIRTQDLESAYHDAGQFIWGTNEAWKNNSRVHSSAVGHVIARIKAVDIDNEQNWKHAENLKKIQKDYNYETK